MPFRVLLAVALAGPLALAAPAFAAPAFTKDPAARASVARDPAPPAALAATEPSAVQSAARQRQKKCGGEWRALSVSDKAAQGPKWPQYFSKCVKRLKEIKA